MYRDLKNPKEIFLRNLAIHKYREYLNESVLSFPKFYHRRKELYVIPVATTSKLLSSD